MKSKLLRFKTQILALTPTQLLVQTVQKWQRDECAVMGAALSYYALFSLFPMLLVILSVVGFLLGPEVQGVEQMLTYAKTALPPQAYGIFEDALLQLNASSVGAGITGFILLLFTSSNVFGQLGRAVDRIWKVHEERRPLSLRSSILAMLLDRLFAFSLVLIASVLMLASLFANVALKTIQGLLETFNQLSYFIDLDEVLILKNIQIGVTFLILIAIVLLLFKILPSTTVRWRDIWLGGVLTTSLMVGLQQLISNSVIQIGSQYQSYGLVGGVMVLMLWLYLTCQIFFIGNVFNYVYAHLCGSRKGRRSEQM